MGFALESFDSGSALGKGLERKGMMSRKGLTGEECVGSTSGVAVRAEGWMLTGETW